MRGRRGLSPLRFDQSASAEVRFNTVGEVKELPSLRKNTCQTISVLQGSNPAPKFHCTRPQIPLLPATQPHPQLFSA